MRLNPFHPERYWTHLARPLFHLDRHEEALAVLSRITRLRRDDYIYRVAASARLGDAETAESNAADLVIAFPDLDPIAFAHSMPYERETDLRALLDALGMIDWNA